MRNKHVRAFVDLYARAYRGLPRSVWLFALVVLVYRTGTMVLPFLTLYLTSERGFSLQHAGVAMSCYGLGALAGTMAGGYLADAFGTPRILIGSLLGAAIVLAMIPVIESIPVFLLAIFLLSIASEAFRPVSATAMAQLVPKTLLARTAALRRMAINLGGTLGPALGGFIAVRSYRALFWVEALACVVAIVLLRCLIAVPKRPTPTDTETPATTRSPWRDRAFLHVFVLTSIFALVFFQVFSTFPLVLNDEYGLREDQIGLVLSVNALVIVLVEMALAQRLKDTPVHYMLRSAGFMIGLGFALTPFGSTLWYAIMVMIVLTWGEMLYMPFCEAWIARRAGRNMGQYMGSYAFAYSLAFTMAPVLGMWVLGHWGSQVLWLGCGLVGGLLYLAYTLFGKREIEPKRAQSRSRSRAASCTPDHEPL